MNNITTHTQNYYTMNSFTLYFIDFTTFNKKQTSYYGLTFIKDAWKWFSFFDNQM